MPWLHVWDKKGNLFDIALHIQPQAGDVELCRRGSSEQLKKYSSAMDADRAIDAVLRKFNTKQIMAAGDVQIFK